MGAVWVDLAIASDFVELYPRLSCSADTPPEHLSPSILG